jgi:hypothetical protein
VFRDHPLTMTAPSFRCEQIPLWPSGAARLDDGILEVLAGDGLRIPVRDVVEIGLEPALGARLQLALSYRRGIATEQRRFWVALEDHDALARLIREVRALAANRRMHAFPVRDTPDDAGPQRADRR